MKESISLKETRNIDTLSNWDKNPRSIAKNDFERLKKQIKELGQYKPLLITNEGVVLGGNMRLRAYKELNITDVWVSVVEAKTEEEKIKYALSDNDRAGKYELDLLGDMVGNFPDLQWADYSIDIDPPKTIDKFIDMFPEEIEDSIPDVVDDPISKLGEIYSLGRHRLMCGDATNKDHVESLMDGKKADMVFHSPPYNVGGNIGYKNKSKYKNSNDDLTDYKDLIVNSTRIAIDNAIDVFVNLQLLSNNKRDILVWLADMADYFKDIFFWKKLQVAPAISENVANSQVEIILLFGRENTSRRWGNRWFRGDFTNHIETNSATRENKNSAVHNATFPVALPSRFIKHGYKEGSAILDMFVGTGTTIIACEQLGMNGYGMDIDPLYIDICRKRYAKFINKEEEWEKITPLVGPQK